MKPGPSSLEAVLELVISWGTTTALLFAVLNRDLRRLAPDRLERAWPVSTKRFAVVMFGPLAALVHFARTRSPSAPKFAAALALAIVALAVALALASDLLALAIVVAVGLAVTYALERRGWSAPGGALLGVICVLAVGYATDLATDLLLAGIRPFARAIEAGLAAHARKMELFGYAAILSAIVWSVAISIEPAASAVLLDEGLVVVRRRNAIDFVPLGDIVAARPARSLLGTRGVHVDLRSGESRWYGVGEDARALADAIRRAQSRARP